MNPYKQVIHVTTAFAISILGFSCSDFVQLDPPKSKVKAESVFNDDVSATSAVRGIYVNMLDVQSFSSGSNRSVTALASLSADALKDYYGTDVDNVEFGTNTITPSNSYIQNLWSSAYKIIYGANAVLEGTKDAPNLTRATQRQLTGEARFIRAFTYFYLVNLFGDVPLIMSTDYKTNALVGRTTTAEIYQQILSDLSEARELLTDNYATKGRVRPNKATATAFLARVYLYLEDWEKADQMASEIIGNATYSLVDVSEAFLADNKEAIWQLQPVVPNFNTQEGFYFVISYRPQYNVLTSDFINSFEAGDKRGTNWIGTFQAGSELLYFPNKYKKYLANSTTTEYSVVLRLAEQYLIRAEARAHLGDLGGSMADVDVIRQRASLPLLKDTTPSLSAAEILLAIEKERRSEFFTEWGHRWLDLKRTGRANAVLSYIKPGWNSEDTFYPLPESEFNKNPKLGNQNPGY